MGELLDALIGRGPLPGFIDSPEAADRHPHDCGVSPEEYVRFSEEARLAVRAAMSEESSSEE